jgi:hypothetical protein
VAFGAGEALRGGVGLRIGDIWLNTPAWEVDTSITGKAWDQFITKNGVTLETLGGGLVIDDLYAKIFGEVVTQVNITQKGSGVSAYMSRRREVQLGFHCVHRQGRRPLSVVGATVKWRRLVSSTQDGGAFTCAIRFSLQRLQPRPLLRV